MKNDKARKDNQLKAETVTGNKAKADFQYNLIKQRVRLENKKDSFWIDAEAMLPAVQDHESTRENGSAIKAIEYSSEYLQFLCNELVASIGIKSACDRVLNKCYMIKFNEQVGKILKSVYRDLHAKNPNVPVSKFDVEKAINEHATMKHFNETHSWPKSASTDKNWKDCVSCVNSMIEENNPVGAKDWSEERIQQETERLYAEVLEHEKSNPLNKFKS